MRYKETIVNYQGKFFDKTTLDNNVTETKLNVKLFNPSSSY